MSRLYHINSRGEVKPCAAKSPATCRMKPVDGLPLVHGSSPEETMSRFEAVAAKSQRGSSTGPIAMYFEKKKARAASAAMRVTSGGPAALGKPGDVKVSHPERLKLGVSRIAAIIESKPRNYNEVITTLNNELKMVPLDETDSNERVRRPWYYTEQGRVYVGIEYKHDHQTRRIVTEIKNIKPIEYESSVDDDYDEFDDDLDDLDY